MAELSRAFRIGKNGLSFGDTVYVFEGVEDPTAGAGISASKGSLYIRHGSSPELWQKSGDNDTEWSKISSSGTLHNLLSQIQGGATNEYYHFTEDEHTSLVETVELKNITFEPNGFTNRTDTTMSFVDGTRVFTVIGTDYDFYVEGKKINKTSNSTVTITNTEGLHYIYLDGTGTLVSTTTFTPDIIRRYAFVASLYWDVTNSKQIYLGDERHGIVMDGETHSYLHLTNGTRWISGLSLGSFILDANGSLSTHAQFSVGTGTIRDEDLTFTIPDFNAPATFEIFYRSGANGDWRVKTADSFPLIYSGTAGYTGANGRIPFNEFTGSTWQLTEVSSGNYIIMLYFAINEYNSGKRFVGVQGQNQYTTVGNARTAITTELSNLSKNGMSFVEFCPIGAVIFQTSSYTNTPNARIRSVDGGSLAYEDLRAVQGSSSGNVSATSHSSLTNRTDANSHPASAISLLTTSFDNNLSSLDDSVQKALETLDDIIFGGGIITKYTTVSNAESATGVSDESVIYVEETNSFYYRDSTSSESDNNLHVLTSADGGRFIGFAGKYMNSSNINNLTAYNTTQVYNLVINQQATFETTLFTEFSASSTNIDWNNSDLITYTASSNVTLSFSNPRKTFMTLIITASGANRIITFPTAFWDGEGSVTAKQIIINNGFKSFFTIYNDGSSYYISYSKFHV